MIYLDNNATTKPSPAVVASMLPYLTEHYSNPSATTAAYTGVDRPRYEAATAMAELLNAEDPACLAFTSGATESNNWVFALLPKKRRGRILISSIEHPSVAEPAARLHREGFEVTEIAVDAHGVVRLDCLCDALGNDTVLISVMAANNETGAIQPIRQIGQLVRAQSPQALFHTDATQAVGKILIDLQCEWDEVDLLSFSAHKFHGPKGIGGLYIRPGADVQPMMLGGGQENGLRSGTSNTPGLAGLACAAVEAQAQCDRVQGYRDCFEQRLLDVWPEAVIHSMGVLRLPNTSFFSLPGVQAEELAAELAAAGVIIGTGAACSAGAIEPSKTLRAMGVPHNTAEGAVRVSMSKFSSMADIDALVFALRDALPLARATA